MGKMWSPLTGGSCLLGKHLCCCFARNFAFLLKSEPTLCFNSSRSGALASKLHKVDFACYQNDPHTQIEILVCGLVQSQQTWICQHACHAACALYNSHDKGMLGMTRTTVCLLLF